MKNRMELYISYYLIIQLLVQQQQQQHHAAIWKHKLTLVLIIRLLCLLLDMFVGEFQLPFIDLGGVELLPFLYDISVHHCLQRLASKWFCVSFSYLFGSC